MVILFFFFVAIFIIMYKVSFVNKNASFKVSFSRVLLIFPAYLCELPSNKKFEHIQSFCLSIPTTTTTNNCVYQYPNTKKINLFVLQWQLLIRSLCLTSKIYRLYLEYSILLKPKKLNGTFACSHAFLRQQID